MIGRTDFEKTVHVDELTMHKQAATDWLSISAMNLSLFDLFIQFILSNRLDPLNV